MNLIKNTIKSKIYELIYGYLANLYVYLFARPKTQFVNDFLFTLAIRGRGYENCCDPKVSGELQFIKYLSEHNPKVCLDIGANIGNYSKLLLTHTNSKVFAFEPLPEAYNKLIVIQEAHPEKFFPFNLGVGQKNELKTLFYGSETSEIASFCEEANSIDYVGQENLNSLQASVVSLDSFFADRNLITEIDFIKIDTEGFELDVLLGAPNTIRAFKPKFIQIEFNWHHLFVNHTLRLISEVISDYDAYQLLPHKGGMVKRNLNLPDFNVFKYSNFVFIRKDLRLDDQINIGK